MKTPEEKQRIMDVVKMHHEEVKKWGFNVVFTSLVGSQNYNLDDEKSDIDTFSFILPALPDLAMAREPYAKCWILDDNSHCEVKDVRLALNLLRKTSPNSVEYFASKYKVFNPVFEPLLREYLDDNTKLWTMLHCNYSHMLYAMAGMAHQLTKRNMSAGKRYAHALRLMDMCYNFVNNKNAQAVLDLRGDTSQVIAAKRDTGETHDAFYNEQCEQIASWLDNFKENFVLTPEQESAQMHGNVLLDALQNALFYKYLMEKMNK